MNELEEDFMDEAVLVPRKPAVSQTPRMPDNGILVERTYHASGTHGVLTFADDTRFYTLERAWVNNERRISCIPEGIYKLVMRYSPIVQRTSGGEYTSGYEITGVKDRDLIMIHVGNYVKDTEGCLLVGMSEDFQNGEPVVWSSRLAFRLLMTKMAGRDNWQIRFKEQ